MNLLSDLPVPPGCALVATGSLARGELAPHSDLDLLLLHPEGKQPDVEKLWYPLWNSDYRVDHAVRTPAECAGMMSADSTAALALLEMRHLAGDAELSARTREMVLREWRVEIHRNFNALVATAIARWRRSGSVVAMTHPDLKNGRGGLRDLDLIRALALAQLCDEPPLAAERQLLLDVRARLHTHARRRRDILDPEFATDIAADLRLADRHELSRHVAAAARRIDAAVTNALATARGVLGARVRGERRPLDVDVVDDGGEITLSRHPDLGDPALLLRVAAAAARTGLPVSGHTWARLHEVPDVPEVLPAAAAEDFFALLTRPEVINDLDAHGLWTRLVPEWEHIRGRMPRERTHIHTIDQHSIVTVAHCAAAGVSVARPDLLMLGALFHDIGKGYGRPHEQVGAEFVARMAARLGLHLPDRSRVQTLVAEHTTIARLAARHDPTADTTLDMLLDAVHYDRDTLDLLEVLTEADAKATGPGVWNSRLESGLRMLVQRARQALDLAAPLRPHIHTPEGVLLRRDGDLVTITARGEDPQGLLAVLAAKAWKLTAARIVGGHAEYDARPTVETLAELDEAAFIQAHKSGVHAKAPAPGPAPTWVSWHGQILEVRTTVRVGAFAALLRVLPEAEWLSMTTPGATMIVQAAFTGPVDRRKVDRDVTRVLGNG
ncbi:MAG: [protein-PII] uridylyltransferase [Corynebacterium sp.]|uniref:[protein-PII] uridylyltransferase n=1 Tax=Corynebacterium sp. TaxID=1720 RepID=UPI0026E07F63|nr:[protein-PII] uridylyltransferase [Corynebacterium sp.]MDO5668907.1 [protein-PII] uridylyltransferase [Corynebacterium sp.]